MHEYPREKRTEIFDAERPELGSPPSALTRDLAYAMAFIYSGTQDASDPHARFFERVLKAGVSSGEIDLGNAEDPHNVMVDFDAEISTGRTLGEITEKIENDEWGDLQEVEIQYWIREMKDSSESFDPGKFLSEAGE